MPSKVKSHPKTRDSLEEEKLPKEWPTEINYLSEQTYSKAVTPEQRIALSRSTPETVSYARIAAEALKLPCALVEIRIISNTKHPACSQRGLFAAQNLEPDSFICLYLGYVHTNSLSDTDPHSDYDLAYDKEGGLSIDSAHCGNESRFANDYRGIAERPNIEFRDCLVQVKSEKRADGMKWERRVGIFVLPAGKAGKRQGGIKAGEEILVNYGKGFWEGRQMLAKFRKDFDMRT